MRPAHRPAALAAALSALSAVHGLLTDDPNILAGHAFDFIVAGGGTGGLVLAARLSEDPSISVGAFAALVVHG